MNMRFGTVAIAFACGGAFAGDLRCTQDERTSAMQCVSTKAVRMSMDDIRYTTLYMGGPNEMTKTNFTVHTNCVTGVTHLKDRAGVSFAGGAGRETKALIELRTIICNASYKQDKK